MPLIKAPSLVGSDFTVSAGNTSIPFTDYSSATEVPVVIELGTARTDRFKVDNTPVTETISTGAAGTNKTLVIVLNWGDDLPDADSDMAATIDTVDMQLIVESYNSRTNVSILSHPIPSGGDVDLVLQPTNPSDQIWQGYSYRVFTVTGDFTLDGFGVIGSDTETLDLSANVADTTEVVGGVHCNNDGNAGFSYSGVTEDVYAPGDGFKAFAHFSASPLAEETPRSMSVEAPSGSGSITAAILAINPVGVEAQTPVVSNSTLLVNENSFGSINVVSAPIATDPQGQALTCTAASVDEGSVTFADGENIIYTPAADYTGAATIDFTVQDTDGNSSSGKIFVTVTEVADFTVYNQRYCVLEDAEAITSIDTPPARGTATLVDGLIFLDMYGETSTEAMSVSYTRETSGSVTRTINVGEAWYPRGDHKGEFWRPPLNSDGTAVIEPGENARYVHVSTTGLDAAAIASAEGLSAEDITGSWLKDNLATGETVYYGETEALALQQEEAENLIQRLETSGDPLQGLILLFKKGDTFYGWRHYVSNATLRRTGDSPLHPNIVGSYGTGNRPRFEGGTVDDRGGQLPKLFSGSFYIYSGLDTGGANAVDSTSSYVAYCDVQGDYAAIQGKGDGAQIDCGGNGDYVDHFSIIGCKLHNCWGAVPKDNNQLAYDSMTSAFTVGETVTGGTSGASGVIAKITVDSGDPNAGVLELGTVTNKPFQAETITSAGGSATATGAETDWAWGGQKDTKSALHAGKTFKCLVEGYDVFNSGHGLYYRRDLNGYHDKGPETYAHGIYFSGSMLDTTVRNSMIYHSGGTEMQFRSGGIIENHFGAANQSGITLGNGPLDRRKWRWFYDQYLAGTNEPYTGEDLGRFGGWSSVIKTVQTHGGWKSHDVNNFNKTRVGGKKVGGAGYAFIDSLTLNRGEPYAVLNNPTDIGPGMVVGYNVEEGDALGINSQANPTKDGGDPGMIPSVLTGKELMIGNWGPNSTEQGVDHVLQATRDALTIQDWTDTELSTSGSSYIDFSDHITSIDRTWANGELFSLLDYFLTPFGVLVPSSRSGQTVNLTGVNGVPWNRADIWVNWSTENPPGSVSGDTVDFSECPVQFRWNMQNDHKFVDVLMNDDVVASTGVLDTTTVTPASGGTSLTMETGVRVYLDSYSGSDVLDVNMLNSRFMVRGTVDGNIGITAGYKSEFLVYEGGDFTADSDMTLSGFAPCGFDGDSGGSASITLASGNTLTIKETQRIPVRLDQFLDIETSTSGGITTSVNWNFAYRPVIGAKLIGATTNAEGTVVDFIKKTSSAGASPYLDGWIVVEDVVGTFNSSEVIRCERDWGTVNNYGEGVIGNITGASETEYGKLREFRSGINGTDAPNVNSSITLGGTLNISEVPNNTEIISADTITGSFSTVVGGTVTVTGTTVTKD